MIVATLPTEAGDQVLAEKEGRKLRRPADGVVGETRWARLPRGGHRMNIFVGSAGVRVEEPQIWRVGVSFDVQQNVKAVHSASDLQATESGTVYPRARKDQTVAPSLSRVVQISLFARTYDVFLL